MKKLGLLATVIAAIAFSAAPADALDQNKTCEQTDGVTTVTWDCSFKDTNYTELEPVTMLVDWTVDVGFASFNKVELKSKPFGPKGKDQVTGTLPTITLLDNTDIGDFVGQVLVVVVFTNLSGCFPDGPIGKGKAHLKLFLDIDDDGKAGGSTSLVSYGFNLAVRDPDC